MNLRFILISIFLFGIYSRFHLNIGPLYVPFIFSFLSGVGLLLLNKGMVNTKTFSFLIIFSIISVFLSFVTIITLDVKARDIIESLVFFIYSIALSVLLFDELLKYSNERLSRYFLKTVYVVLFFCLLDIFTPFHALNIEVLDFFGGHNQGRFSANREAAYFFGIRRPFPFTLEPSHVSKFLFVLLTGWLMLTPKKNFRLFYVICILSLLIVRSPVIIGAIIAALFFQFTDKAYRKNIRTYAATLSIVLVLLAVSTVFVYIVLEARIRSVLSGGDPSTYLRLFRPFLILIESINYSPLIGVGVGNTEKLAELYLANNTLWVNRELGSGYTVSALVAPLTYWGIVGTSTLLITFIQYVRSRITVTNLLTLLLMYFMISIAMGGFNTVNYLAYIMIIIRSFTLDLSQFNR